MSYLIYAAICSLIVWPAWFYLWANPALDGTAYLVIMPLVWLYLMSDY